jgi:very-short-patch-repair endonuclease
MPHSNIKFRVRQRARRLRKKRTRGEKAMQEYLRALRPFGAHFRREARIGPFIVDFAWLSQRIAIEVDGAPHDLPGRAERDFERDTFLKSQGFRVICLRDTDIIGNSADAFARIEEAVRPLSKSPGVTPPRAPSHKGEGN